MLNEYKSVVEYLTDVTITCVTITLIKFTHWLGFVVEINCPISTSEQKLCSISKIGKLGRQQTRTRKKETVQEKNTNSNH